MHLSQEEIAAKFEMPVGTVNYILNTVEKFIENMQKDIKNKSIFSLNSSQLNPFYLIG